MVNKDEYWFVSDLRLVFKSINHSYNVPISNFEVEKSSINNTVKNEFDIVRFAVITQNILMRVLSNNCKSNYTVNHKKRDILFLTITLVKLYRFL